MRYASFRRKDFLPGRITNVGKEARPCNKGIYEDRREEKTGDDPAFEIKLRSCTFSLPG